MPSIWIRLTAAGVKTVPSRAYCSESLGDLSAFRLRDVVPTAPQEGQLRLMVEATALGHVDALVMKGLYQIRPPVPFTPGGEIVGRVEALGAGVSGFTVGDRVACWQFGEGLADQAIVYARTAVSVRDRLGSVETASFLLDFLTAYHGLFDRGRLQAGQTVLVAGASGGVGSAAIQLARNAAAQTIALASGRDKMAYVAALGANHVVDYRKPNWREEVRAVIPGGVNLVFDPVGGAVFEPCFRSLAKRGRHLVIGFAAGGAIPSLPSNLVLLKSGELVGVDVRYLAAFDPGRVRRILSIILGMAADARISRSIAKVYSLSQAAAAIAALGDSDRIGKIVVAP